MLVLTLSATSPAQIMGHRKAAVKPSRAGGGTDVEKFTITTDKTTLIQIK